MNIDELKQQVESAIALFTLVDERNLSFCQGLLDSLKAIERKHLESRADMTQLGDEVERLTQENQQLRAMLQSLVVAVGAGRHQKLEEIRARLERHVGRLTQSRGGQPNADPTNPEIDKSDMHPADDTFTVPDTNIDEIVARIAEKTEPDTGQPSA